MKNLSTLTLTPLLFASCSASGHGANGENETSKTTTMTKKETVGKFLGAVLQGDTETMRALANADYIQHNPFIPTGLEPFIQLLPVLEENGTTAENVRMFQDGNYVFMHNI